MERCCPISASILLARQMLGIKTQTPKKSSTRGGRPYSGGLSSLFSQAAFSDLIGLRSAPFGRVRTWDIRRLADRRPQVRVRYGLASWELGTWGNGVARSG